MFKYNLRKKIGGRVRMSTTKLRNKLNRALGTPISRKERKRKLFRILVVATVGAIGIVTLYSYPPTRKLLISYGFKIKSKINEVFSSINSDADVDSSSLGNESKRIPRNNDKLFALVSLVFAIIVKVYVNKADAAAAAAAEEIAVESSDQPTTFWPEMVFKIGILFFLPWLHRP